MKNTPINNPTPGAFYRADLICPIERPALAEVAKQTGLSIMTIRKAYRGEPIQMAHLWTLAEYFGISWLALHDLAGTVSPFGEAVLKK